MLVLAMEFSRDGSRRRSGPETAGSVTTDATAGPPLPGQPAWQQNGRCRKESA